MGIKWDPKADPGLFDADGVGYGISAIDLYKWYNRDAFSCAWELLKQAQGGQFTAWQLAHALGCSQRTLYRWLNEETYYPQCYFLGRMGVLFQRILGDDWMEKVKQLQIALGTKKQIEPGGSE